MSTILSREDRIIRTDPREAADLIAPSAWRHRVRAADGGSATGGGDARIALPTTAERIVS